MLRSWSFLKSILSGGITALVDLSLLFVFREPLHWPYWLAINSAFVIAILVNFSLQRFWAFSHQELHLVHKHFARFIFVAMGNFMMNSLIMFLLSVTFGIWYLWAQVLTTGMLAVVNFTLYRRFVFN
jgi:putative flippase GtrA